MFGFIKLVLCTLYLPGYSGKIALEFVSKRCPSYLYFLTGSLVICTVLAGNCDLLNILDCLDYFAGCISCVFIEGDSQTISTQFAGHCVFI